MSAQKKASPKGKKPSAPRRQPDEYAAHQQGQTERERRIDEIIARMESGAWLTGVSHRALAKEWKVAPDTVRKLAQEASHAVRRFLRFDKDAQENARAAIVQTFEVIRAKAMAKGDPQSLRVALDATRALGFYMGVEPAKRLEVAPGRETDFMQGWSLQEKEAYCQGGESARRAVRRGGAGGVLPRHEANGLDDDAGEMH